MKVVINGCYGGFSLSKKAVYWLAEKGHVGAKKEIAEQNAAVAKWGTVYPSSGDPFYLEKAAASNWDQGDTDKLMSYSWHLRDDDDLPRHHPLLIECVETLGDDADGACASLKVVEIPDGVDYEVEEYDGNEWVAEKHRRWS